MMETYRYTCRCGKRSASFNSRKSARDWHAQHVREDCAAPRRAAKPRHALDWKDADELLRHVQKLRPIDPGLNSAGIRTGPGRDSSIVDSWGKRKGGPSTWVDTNCLRACIATILQVPIKRVPDPTRLFSSSDNWFADYDDELAKAIGVRMETCDTRFSPLVVFGLLRWRVRRSDTLSSFATGSSSTIPRRGPAACRCGRSASSCSRSHSCRPMLGNGSGSGARRQC